MGLDKGYIRALLGLYELYESLHSLSKSDAAYQAITSKRPGVLLQIGFMRFPPCRLTLHHGSMHRLDNAPHEQPENLYGTVIYIHTHILLTLRITLLIDC